MFDITRLVATFLAAVQALRTGDATILPNPVGRDKFIPSADALEGGAVGRARQTQTVITGLVVVIVASLAVIVVDQFDTSLGSPSSSQLSNAQNNVLSGFADMMDLIGPLLLVLIAAVVIGVISNVRE